MDRLYADNQRALAAPLPGRRAAVGVGELLALALILLVAFALIGAAHLHAPALTPIADGRITPGPTFLDGLYGPETDPQGDGYRWTRGAALVQLRGAFFTAPAYRAALRLRADNPAGPQPLTLLAGGRPVATVTPEARFRTYQLLIGPQADAGAELWLALQTPTFSAPLNPRPLGVILTDVTLAPITRPSAPGALATVLCLLALWALLRAAGVSPMQTLGLVGVAALAAVGAAAIDRPAAIPLTWLVGLATAAVAGATIVARQPAARLGLAALAALVALAGLIWPPWLSDDAFISFRYAQNLVAGHGLVYNVGERVEGYTNFLWTILAAGVIALGGDVALWSHLAGAALGVAIVLLSYTLAARLLGPAWALVAALIVGTSQSLLLYTARGSGLETGLFTLLLLAASERYLASGGARRGPLVATGLLLALAALTRPEGLMVFALTAAHLLATPGRRSRRWPARSSPSFCPTFSGG